LDDRDWYSDERATFGDRVVGAREGAGLTQDELARRLGIRPRTLQSWEEDASEPRANKLQMLAGLTGVSMRWLMTGQGDGPQPPGEEMGVEAAALLAELRQLRGEFARGAERLGRLEKRLRTSLGP
jgi:transcriptional regulator with XRE-family HTH domain